MNMIQLGAVAIVPLLVVVYFAALLIATRTVPVVAGRRLMTGAPEAAKTPPVSPA